MSNDIKRFLFLFGLTVTQVLILIGILFPIFESISRADMLKVAIMDTGLDLEDPRFKYLLCSYGHKDFTGEGIQDDDTHGTHIAGLIKVNAGFYNRDYCLIIVKWLGLKRHKENTVKAYMEALKYISEVKPDIVNISGGGISLENEYTIIKSIPSTVFVVATGNRGLDMKINKNNRYYPASLTFDRSIKNVVPVGSLTDKGLRVGSSNYGAPRMQWEIGDDVVSTFPEWYCQKFGNTIPRSHGCMGIMSGTSMATAVHTGKLIKKHHIMNKCTKTGHCDFIKDGFKF